MVPNIQPIPITNILLAEDNLEHCFFFKKALHEIAPQVKYNEVHSGDILMTLLFSFIPDLLFIDLTMPCKHGVECIKEIRENRAYDSLPIVVFSLSDRAHSIQTAYGFGANLYVVKPAEYPLLVTSLREILTMDWTDHRTITAKHFQNNKYHPFEMA